MIVSKDTTWSAEGGPYTVEGPVQIAAGATLTIGQGAEVDIREPIQVEGGLEVVGSPTNPVRVSSTKGLFSGIGAYNQPGRHVTIQHSDVAGPGAIMVSTTARVAISITDSSLHDIVDTNYLWYPSALRIERNVFTSVNTLEVGTDHDVFGTILNNRFRLAPTNGFDGYNGDSQIVSWASYNATPLQVTGNVFEDSIKSNALEVSIDGAMDASSNYFGSRSEAEVASLVIDKSDDLRRPGVIAVSPLLTSAPPEVPVAESTSVRTLTTSPQDQAVRLSWQPPLSDGGSPITGYVINNQTDGTVVEVPANPTSAVMTGLRNGVAYQFTVSARTARGVGDAATSPSVTPAGLPGSVVAPLVSVVKDKITVRWTAAPNNGSPITRYSVTGVSKAPKSVSGTSTRTTFKRVPKGTYSIQVVAINALGSGEPSPATVAKVKRVRR